MTKRARLNAIIECCKIRFDRGDVTAWKHSDFVDLHIAIRRDTSVNISPSTLKRIFGKISVEEDYVPQQATLDALKQYGKYVEPENQQPIALPVDQPQPEPLPILPQAEIPPVVQPDLSGKEVRSGRFKVFLIALTVIVVIAGLFTWRLLKSQSISGKISLLRTEGHLPATAFFELQLPPTDDSLFVNFGDKSPLTYIAPGAKNAAHIYFIPGVFAVSVQSRHQTIATTTAFIRSDSWVAMVFHNQQEIPDHFYKFAASKTGSDSSFQVTNSQVASRGLDTTGVILTRLCNYTPVAHNADDFVFETTFKNAVPEKSNYCLGTQFQISGSNSMIRFKLVSAGCSLRVINMVSEQTFSGATTDLSQFVLDLNQWNTVKLVNHKKRVSLFVNGKQIFTGTYQRSLGDVRGVFLEFEGTGSVKTYDLKSYEGKILYHF